MSRSSSWVCIGTGALLTHASNTIYDRGSDLQAEYVLEDATTAYMFGILWMIIAGIIWILG